LVLEDSPGLSDSSNDANRADELADTYAPGCTIELARLTEAGHICYARKEGQDASCRAQWDRRVATRK
jgi:hypothetical protein